jgi:hypothetical protein
VIGLAIGLVIVVLVEVWFVRFLRSKWRKIKVEYSKDGPPIWPI